MSEKFMFYENFLDAINQLPEEQRGCACYEICKYGITGELPTDPMLKMFCIGVSASVQKYQGRGGARTGAGAPKGNKNAQKQEDTENNQNNQNNQKFQKIQNEQTETKNINFKQETIPPDNNKLLSSPKGDSLPSKRFIKPTVEEISTYCQERNNTISAEQFYNFYESKGWRVGNQPMKDWKAAVRTWEAKDKTKNDNDFWRQLGC